MDYLPHFRREIEAFQAAVRRVAGAGTTPLVPSCPGWSVSDLVMHLGGVHRYLTPVLRDRLAVPPAPGDLSVLRLPADPVGWPAPEHAPNRGPMPPGLVDWFAEAASALE